MSEIAIIRLKPKKGRKGKKGGCNMDQKGGNPLAAISLGLAALKAAKPVSTIDKILEVTGVRDKVRDKLNSNKFGKMLVDGADYAKDQLGYGKKKKRTMKKKRTTKKKHMKK
jgi:hypothetical protein